MFVTVLTFGHRLVDGRWEYQLCCFHSRWLGSCVCTMDRYSPGACGRLNTDTVNSAAKGIGLVKFRCNEWKLDASPDSDWIPAYCISSSPLLLYEMQSLPFSSSCFPQDHSIYNSRHVFASWPTKMPLYNYFVDHSVASI